MTASGQTPGPLSRGRVLSPGSRIWLILILKLGRGRFKGKEVAHPAGGLSALSLHRLICLNTWSLDGGLTWDGCEHLKWTPWKKQVTVGM